MQHITDENRLRSDVVMHHTSSTCSSSISGTSAENQNHIGATVRSGMRCCPNKEVVVADVTDLNVCFAQAQHAADSADSGPMVHIAPQTYCQLLFVVCCRYIHLWHLNQIQGLQPAVVTSSTPVALGLSPSLCCSSSTQLWPQQPTQSQQQQHRGSPSTPCYDGRSWADRPHCMQQWQPYQTSNCWSRPGRISDAAGFNKLPNRWDMIWIIARAAAANLLSPAGSTRKLRTAAEGGMSAQAQLTVLGCGSSCGWCRPSCLLCCGADAMCAAGGAVDVAYRPSWTLCTKSMSLFHAVNAGCSYNWVLWVCAQRSPLGGTTTTIGHLAGILLVSAGRRLQD